MSLHKQSGIESSIKRIYLVLEDEVIELNSDFSKFYKKPALPEVTYENVITEKNNETGQMKFLSEVENGSSNKDVIFHYNKYLGTDNTNIIFVHGWRAVDLTTLKKMFSDIFIERGYNIYSYLLPFHMERAPKESLYSGKYYISANVSRTIKTVQQSVIDIRALIGHIKAENYGKVIIMGLSLGGITTNLLSEVEENIDVLIFLFYANDLSFTVFETEAGKNTKKDFF